MSFHSVLSGSCETDQSARAMNAVWSSASLGYPGALYLAAYSSDSTQEQDNLRKKFEELAAAWIQNTEFMSNIVDISTDENYQKIIGMGPGVVQFILEDLIAEPRHWFWALHALTNVDPTERLQSDDLYAVRDAWIAWGKRSGYVK